MMMQQLSPQDAQFLYIETGNNLTHVMGVNIFDPSTAPGGKVRFKDIIEHVESLSVNNTTIRIASSR